MAADAAYASLALSAIPRLLGKLDREPLSLTHGSFDREHWSWKFRDFPIGPLQMGMCPLALLWRQPFAGSSYCGSARLRDWIVGCIEHTLTRQKRAGAFQAFAPRLRPRADARHLLCAEHRPVRRRPRRRASRATERRGAARCRVRNALRAIAWIREQPFGDSLLARMWEQPRLVQRIRRPGSRIWSR